MTPEHAFLWSIKESPADDGVRLIFADWLEDNGQPERAELLRLQVDQARLPSWQLSRRAELKERIDELLAAHGPQWLGPWAGVGQFQRGLIHIDCHAARLPELLATAGGETALAWVKGLSLYGAGEENLAVLGSPWFCHISSLALAGNEITYAGVAAMAASPRLARFSHLIGDAGAAALAASPHLASLSYLNLGLNGIGDAGAEALAASPHLAHLSYLYLADNRIGNAGAAALANSPHRSRLLYISL